MAHLTNAQATTLVDGGTCLLREIDTVYQYHKFSGKLDGEYYECTTPNQVDLSLDVTSTEAECKTAFIDWFENNCDYQGVEPVIDDTTVW